MLTILAAVMLAADGGGSYALDLDYEFTSPEASKSPLSHWTVITQSGNAQAGTPGGTTIYDFDGGMVFDENGLRCIHGPTDIFYRLGYTAVDFPAPDAGGGGRVEMCYHPAFDTSRECSGATTPYWLGTNYALDLYNGASTHTGVFVIGHGTCDQLFMRTSSLSQETDFTINNSGDRLGKNYCISYEWEFADSSHCKVWWRRSAYAGRPPLGWAASKVIASDESGTAACPGVTAYAYVCARWNWEAPTTMTVHSFKMGHKL